VAVDDHLGLVDLLAVLAFGGEALDGCALGLGLDGLLYGRRQVGTFDLLFLGGGGKGAGKSGCGKQMCSADSHVVLLSSEDGARSIADDD